MFVSLVCIKVWTIAWTIFEDVVVVVDSLYIYLYGIQTPSMRVTQFNSVSMTMLAQQEYQSERLKRAFLAWVRLVEFFYISFSVLFSVLFYIVFVVVFVVFWLIIITKDDSQQQKKIKRIPITHTPYTKYPNTHPIACKTTTRYKSKTKH